MDEEVPLSAAVPESTWYPTQTFIQLLKSVPLTAARDRLISRMEGLPEGRVLDISDLTPDGKRSTSPTTITKYHLHLGGLFWFIVSRKIEGVKHLITILTEGDGFPLEPYQYLLSDYITRYHQMEKHGNIR